MKHTDPIVLIRRTGRHELPGVDIKHRVGVRCHRWILPGYFRPFIDNNTRWAFI